MKADAVFEGGGVRGIAFVGALCCLEKKGYEWERLAGTSAGAIVASLLAAGYKSEELKDIMYRTNFADFKDKGKLRSIPLIGMPFSLVEEKGFFQGDYFEKWIDELLSAKKKTRFRDICVDGKSRLKIIAADITKRDMIILPEDLAKYNLDPMEFKISRAVRMSMSIPLFYKPVILRYSGGISYIVDGGIVSNYPVWLFDVDGVPRWPTFGFRLIDDKISLTSAGKSDIISFLLDIVGTVTDKNEEIYVKDKDKVRTIDIPTMGVRTTDFQLMRNQNNKLFNSGYTSAEKFLSNWDFKQYVQCFRRGKSIKI